MLVWCVLALVTMQIHSCCTEQTNSVFGRIQSGLRMAGKLLGLDKATEVAQLVTESFGKPRKGHDTDNTQSIFSRFLKLLGLESKKISAIAINAIVFLAQLISSTLSRPPPAILTHGRSLRPGTPLEWIFESTNTKVKELIVEAKDPKLPDRIIEYLRERDTDEDTGCVQLLVCKTSPFLWGMQQALEAKTPGEKTTGATAMLKFLPTRNEFEKFAEKCEIKFPNCNLN